MIAIETEIFRLIFPPAGAVPLEKLDKVPLIRGHIASIYDLANGHEQQFLRPDESAAITARIVELRDSPGPDGLALTWATIADLCNTTVGGARKRYANYKKAQTLATVRKTRIVQPDPTIREYRTVEAQPEEEPTPLPEPTPVHLENVNQDHIVDVDHMVGTPISEQPKTESPTPREAALANLEKLKAEKEVQKAGSLDPETLSEIDRMLAEGLQVQRISRELEKTGKIVSWTKIRARSAYLARMKAKEVAPVAEEAAPQAPEEKAKTKPEPISISRKELDLRIWDMWRAGKTLDEIADILNSEGLYYNAKSVRVRLLSQGAKL